MTLAYRLSPLIEELLVEIEAAAEAGHADLVAALEEQRERMMAQYDDPAALLLSLGRDRLKLEARAAGIKFEQDHLARKRGHLLRMVAELKEVALVFMARADLRRVETGDPLIATVRRQANGGKTPVRINDGIEASAVPKRFQRQPPPEIDLDAVRDALERGETLPWASLGERGEHVRWD